MQNMASLQTKFAHFSLSIWCYVFIFSPVFSHLLSAKTYHSWSKLISSSKSVSVKTAVSKHKLQIHHSEYDGFSNTICRFIMQHIVLDFHLSFFQFLATLLHQNLISHGQICFQRRQSVLIGTDFEEDIRFDHKTSIFAENRQLKTEIQ